LEVENTKMMTGCFNPATGEKLGESNLNTIEEVKYAIHRAKSIQPIWSKRSIRERVNSLRPIRQFLSGHADEIAETISRDNGKTRIDALTTEVLPAMMAFSYYSKHAREFLKDQHLKASSILFANKRSYIRRESFGVIGIISPWNYPFAIPFSEIVMALLAGNAVVLKIASETQMVGRLLEKCFQSAELPKGLFAYLNLPGKIAGDAFLENGIDKLFFTGSVSTGKYLMKKASETLTSVVLELGGNDAMIVCEDADIDRAVGGALWAGLSNAGQSCGGVERIYIHEKIYQPFMKLLKEKVEAIRIGYDADFEVEIGAMTTQKQMNTVKLHIQDALAKGAMIFAQSKISENPNFRHLLPATVLTNVNHEMLVMQEETFGPVIGVMKVKDDKEAIRLANDSHLGLTGSVWSKNRGHAKKIASQIYAGVVAINDHLMSHGLAETPWGGFKESGIGRTHGRLGFDEMTRPQVIINDILPFAKRQMWWYPYNANIYSSLSSLAQMLASKSFLKRIKGFFSLMKILPRFFTKW